jgi:hypothetical protein
MNNLSMFGYNSHDYHVMMIVFLAITIRTIKPVHIKVLITCLCYFFNIVSLKVIGRKELDDLRANMIVIMCILEMCFPPSFLDMQQHLMIHLVDQILTLGPLYSPSMFPYERYLEVLKSYVRNRAHPGGFHYGMLHNRICGRVLRRLCKRWKKDRLVDTTTRG